MLRKFVVLSACLSLLLLDVQPGAAAVISRAMSAPGSVHAEHMDMTGPGMMDGMHMASMDYSCCPGEADRTCDDGAGCGHSWLACALHCGIAASAFVLGSDYALNSRLAECRETMGDSVNLVSEDLSPPFRPPKLFLHA